MISRTGLWLAAAGVASGIPLALWTGRFTASLLFGLTPSDPSTLAAAIVVMVAVVLLAAYLPARRATLIDPATALKHE